MTPVPLRDNATLELGDHGDNARHGDGLRYACVACGREYRSLLLVPVEIPGGKARCGRCMAKLDVTHLTPVV